MRINDIREHLIEANVTLDTINQMAHHKDEQDDLLTVSERVGVGLAARNLRLAAEKIEREAKS